MSASEREAATCCGGEDWCAVTCTGAVLSGKWHPVVVHRLLQEEPLRFNALHRRIGGVSKRVLSDTLSTLEEHGVVRRTVVSDRPVRVEYGLTGRGRDLRPVVAAMEAWGKRHLAAARVASPERGLCEPLPP